MAIVNRRFRRKKKSTKCRNRFTNTSAMQLFKIDKNVLKCKQHVINLSKSKLRDQDYILLSRGLKSIPNPKDKNAKLELLKDFDELARKMRYRYCFHKNSDKLHPFYQKTGYEPEFSCHSLENYISLTSFSYLICQSENSSTIYQKRKEKV
jgi:hypothetical protein